MSNWKDFRQRMARAAKEGAPISVPEKSGSFGMWQKNGLQYGIPLKTKEGFLQLVKLANLEYREHAKENLHPVQLEVLERISAGGTNAILYGEPAKGKTAIALMALKRLHMAGNSIMIRRWSDTRMGLLPKALEAEGVLYGSAISLLSSAKYLLIDELGMGNASRQATDFECQCLLDIINARQSRHGYTIITTNLSLEQLQAMYGKPSFSRLQHKGQRYTKHFDNSMPDYRLKGRP